MLGSAKRPFDMLIVGGGINGTAIARDAAGRGVSVCLCERDDLGAHTSSASSKLIHGGLRYLEHYDFKLVRHALLEREILLKSAPHIIWPLRFVLPYEPQRRPRWLLRMGLFLYDHLGGRKILPPTRTLRLQEGAQAGALRPDLKTGFEYSDCWVEDARLVLLNAMDARDRGADIRPRTEVIGVTSNDDLFRVTIKGHDHAEQTIFARSIINAAGPWVDSIAALLKPGRNQSDVRLVKGSHIVIPRHFDGDQNYIFQNDDGRIIFAMPYESDYTLIGTTDVPYQRGDGPVEASSAEIDYLCRAASEYFNDPIKPADVVWTYSGVRPLYDDHSSEASEVTRDYVLSLDQAENGAPVLSIYGGKVTTSRRLAEHAMKKIAPHLEELGATLGPEWTQSGILPGGEIGGHKVEVFIAAQQRAYPDLPPKLVAALCRRYGARIDQVLENGPGEIFDDHLCEAEIDYAVRQEWAMSVEDILYRRTKAGLHLNDDSKARVRVLMSERVQAQYADQQTRTAIS